MAASGPTQEDRARTLEALEKALDQGDAETKVMLCQKMRTKFGWSEQRLDIATTSLHDNEASEARPTDGSERGGSGTLPDESLREHNSSKTQTSRRNVVKCADPASPQ